jgi:hypothetical protein
MKYLLIFLALSLEAQPLPTNNARNVIWIQPTNISNVSGYSLKWGTNKLNISGASNTTATITLDPGINTLVIRSTPISGTNSSIPVTNIVRILNYTLESSTNMGLTWLILSNYTYKMDLQKGNEIFRTKLDWTTP